MLSTEAENYITHKGINRNRVVLHSDLNNFFRIGGMSEHKALVRISGCGMRQQGGAPRYRSCQKQFSQEMRRQDRASDMAG